MQLPHKLVDLGGGRGLGQGLSLLPQVLDDVLAGQDVLVEHLLKKKMDDSISCNGSLYESNDPTVKRKNKERQNLAHLHTKVAVNSTY